MKEKLTLQKKLEQKKFKIPNKIVYTAYKVLGSIFISRKYHHKCTVIDDINDCKGPCFLVYNHGSRRDHILFMEATYPRRLNILAGYNEFFRSHLHTVFSWMNIIPKKNFTNDMASIKAMTSIIKKGGCVCFSPEGTSSIFGNNQPVVAGTSHFFKHFNIPVYFLKIEGSYLTNNKICEDDRCGEIHTTLSLLFSKEDLEKLSESEIDEKMNSAFRHDDYEWNKTARIEYKSNGRICTNLHDICYKCPKCGKEFTMHGEGDQIVCSNCGNGAKMNDYYDFIPFNKDCKIIESPSKWAEWERQEIIKEIREDENYSITTNVKIGYLPKYKFVKNKKPAEDCGEGKITFDHSGIHFVGTKLNEEFKFDLSYGVIYTLPIVTDLSFFALYINGEFHVFYPETRMVGKLLMVTEEMHRLHFNTWKNFSWNDYMYKLDK